MDNFFEKFQQKFRFMPLGLAALYFHDFMGEQTAHEQRDLKSFYKV